MSSTVVKGALAALVRAIGPRRVLNLVRRADPTLVGGHITSDYPKHLADAPFQAANAAAEAHTLVDSTRRHELWSLVRQSGKLAPGNYLEVGVWRGGTGLILAEAVRHFALTGDIYLADTFSGVVGAGEHDDDYVGGEHADTSEQIVRQLLDKHGHTGVRILKGRFPQDTGHGFEGAIRLLHLDVDVYQSAADALEWAFDRIVPGGIVVFDDYGFSTCSGITRLCEELERDPRFFFLHNWNGHCVLLKRPQAGPASAR